MPRPFDRGDEHSLMSRTRSRDTLWDHTPLLRDEALQSLLVFVVHIVFLAIRAWFIPPRWLEFLCLGCLIGLIGAAMASGPFLSVFDGATVFGID